MYSSFQALLLSALRKFVFPAHPCSASPALPLLIDLTTDNLAAGGPKFLRFTADG
jgi:hypothetical protein